MSLLEERECQRGKMRKFFITHPNAETKRYWRDERWHKIRLLVANVAGCLARLEANIALTLATDKKKKEYKACLKAVSRGVPCKQAREANEGSVQGEEGNCGRRRAELADPHRRNLFRNTNRLELSVTWLD